MTDSPGTVDTALGQVDVISRGGTKAWPCATPASAWNLHIDPLSGSPRFNLTRRAAGGLLVSGRSGGCPSIQVPRLLLELLKLTAR